MKPPRKGNPVERLPDWRVTLPLAEESPAVAREPGAADPAGHRRCQTAGADCTAARAPRLRAPEGLERMRRANTKHGRYAEAHQRLMRFIRAPDSEAPRIVGEL
jgi:hypothetical protein